MNGNVSNTVSPKQVNAIINAIDETTADAKVKAENAASALFAKWKNLWADDISVATARGIGGLVDDSLQELAHGANALKDGVVNIGNFYAQKAGKPSMNAPHTSFNGAINTNVVRDTFDGDEYGFKDPSAIGALVEEVSGLVNTYQNLAQGTAQRINSINAFGNPDIKSQLLCTANNVYENLISTAQLIQKTADNEIQSAAAKYNIGDVSAYFMGGAGMNGSGAIGAIGGGSGIGIGSLSGAVGALGKGASSLVGGVGNLAAGAVGVAGDIASHNIAAVEKGAVSIGKDAIGTGVGVGKGLFNIGKDVAGIGASVGKGAFNVTKDVAGTAADVLSPVTGGVAAIGKGAVKGAVTAGGIAVKGGEAVGGAVVKGATTVGKGAAAVGKGVVGVASDVGDAAVTGVTTVGKGATKVATTVTGATVKGAEAVGSAAYDSLISPVGKGAVSVAKDVGGTAMDVGKGVVNIGKDVAGIGGTAVKGAVSVASDAVDTVADIGKGAGKVVGSIGKGIKKLF